MVVAQIVTSQRTERKEKNKEDIRDRNRPPAGVKQPGCLQEIIIPVTIRRPISIRYILTQSALPDSKKTGMYISAGPEDVQRERISKH